jgi:hypothetical protein
MGIDRATVQFLLNAKPLLSLDRVLTIGRQTMFMDSGELKSLLADNGVPVTLPQAQALLQQEQGYCEPFLRLIGAKEIASMDISSYENATILHDMNQPLAQKHHGEYGLVLDGGSMEHVFNFPTALANCMNAVRLGGHLLIITPANNLLGHGFYQISPELMFRVLGPDNGFELTHMLLYEQPWSGTWYRVVDPEDTKSRVELTNSRPTYLVSCAKRTAIVPLFAKTPQQSDYARIWSAKEEGASLPEPSHGWKQSVPMWMVQFYRRLRPFRPRLYRKLPARF